MKKPFRGEESAFLAKGQPLQSPKAGTCQVCLRNSKEESVAEQSDQKESERKGRRGSREETPVYLGCC